MKNLNKSAGWALCLASVLMLAGFGKLELLVVLLPVSAVLSLGIAAVTGLQDGADRTRKNGIT